MTMILTPKRARKQDRRDNAEYAVRQLTAIRATINEHKLDNESDAMCVRRIVLEWKKVGGEQHLHCNKDLEEASGILYSAESGLPNFATL